jgi:hypothetical protein
VSFIVGKALASNERNDLIATRAEVGNKRRAYEAGSAGDQNGS